jgi:UDP-2,3-diacylglucosamine pyrophosphatase LpxH
VKTIIIFSDTHLCDNSRANDFHHSRALLDMLKKYNDPEKYQIIAAGDIFDDIQADATKIIYYNTPIIKAMHSLKNFTLLPGNHDWIFGKLLNRYWESSTINVEHGHIFDIYNAKPSRIGRQIARLVSWLERLVHKDTDDFLSSIAHAAQHISPRSKEYPGDYSEYKIAADEILWAHNKRICVFGHTHHPGIWTLKHGIYANAGGWTGQDLPTYISITGDKIMLHDALNDTVLRQVYLSPPIPAEA